MYQSEELEGRILITGGAVKKSRIYTHKANGQFAKARSEIWIPEVWDDGWVDRKGRFHVYRPDYLNASESGWAFRHHVIWWLATGQIIRHPLALHHKNGDCLDDRLENLQSMTMGEHTRFHSIKPPTILFCQNCGKQFSKPWWKAKETKYCSLACYHSAPVGMITRNKMRNSRIGKPSGMLGKTQSRETRAKIGIANSAAWKRKLECAFS